MPAFTIERLRPELFLGHARPQPDRALQVLALHHLLHRDGREDVERHAGVVPFAVAGRAFDHRIVPSHAGLLRGLRDIVDIGAERDDRLARAPGCHPRGGNARVIALNLEAFLFQNAGEILRRFELLKAKLAEAEDAVHHHLRLLLHGVDLANQIGLHGRLFFRRDLRCLRLPERAERSG